MPVESRADEWVIVLATASRARHDQPLVQGLGVRTFRLLAIEVANASECTWGDRLYVGPGSWDRVQRIDRRLSYHELTPAVQSILWLTVEPLIRRNETRFIEYYNTTALNAFDAHPLTLLDGLAPDCRNTLITARHQDRFTDFTDLTTRVPCLDRPVELLVERVLVELRDSDDTYHWLTE